MKQHEKTADGEGATFTDLLGHTTETEPTKPAPKVRQWCPHCGKYAKSKRYDPYCSYHCQEVDRLTRAEAYIKTLPKY